MGTDIWTAGDDGNKWPAFNNYGPALDPAEPFLAFAWTTFYRGINNVNTVIEAAPGAPVAAARRDIRVGELKFLRAYYHFNLVRMFGDVPLKLEATTGPTTTETRTPAVEVYAAIIRDAEEAAAVLPAQHPASDWGRITRGAAQHLAAEAYLTRAYLTNSQADFTRAAELAEAVIASGRYTLLPQYASVFAFNNQVNNEVIFSIQWTTDRRTNPVNRHSFMWLAKYDQQPGIARNVENGGATWMRLQPTAFLLGLYDLENDRRYHETFQTMWRASNAATIPRDAQGNRMFELGDTAMWLPNPDDTNVYTGRRYKVVHPNEYKRPRQRVYPNLMKHLDLGRQGGNDNFGSKDLIVYRLGMTHLVAAEAYYQSNNPARAADHLNAVRVRAARPNRASAMQITAAQVNLDFILNEWGVETAGEYRRWFDLVRTGRLVERVRQHNSEADARANIRDHHMLRPIPQMQIDRVTNAFPQNPGY